MGIGEPTETPPGAGTAKTGNGADPAAPGDHTLAPFPTEPTDTAGLLAVVRTPAKKLLDRLYLSLEETGIDFYLSAMHASFGWPLRFLSWRFFHYTRVDPAALARVKEVAARGEVVYAMRHRSLLDYLYLNYLFLREGLPLPRFANEINLWLWLPVGRSIRTHLAKAAWFLRHGFLPDPVDSGWVDGLIAKGKPILVFLKRRRTFMDFLLRRQPKRDLAEALIEGARASPRPVYVIPTALFWDRRPRSGRRNPVDVVFGEADKPNRLRKLWGFLANYREGIASFGEPLDLTRFLAEHRSQAVAITAKKMRWMLLQHIWRERKVVTGSRILPVPAVIKRIHSDPDIKAEVERTAAREGKSVKAIRRRVDKVVWKMAADLRWAWLMVAERLLTWVWNNIYSGMEIDPETLKPVKQAAKDAPLVLVPSHRTHADYLIMSYALYHCDMALPVVAAGDNLSFWPMGYVFRRLGAFFIRRTFRGDALYALILERYLKLLLKAGTTLEFFIEGGRSRTGRVLRPKLGLLTMIVRAWEAGVVEDIALCPLSINYEKVIEEKSYVRELEGGTKTRESVGALFKVFKYLTRNYGQVIVEFAEPLSLKVAMGCDGPTFAARPEGEKRAAIKQLGDHIANGINGVTVVTPSQLVAASLLAHGKRGMLHSTLVETASFLLDFLKAAGVRVSPALGADPPAAFQRAADGFVAEKVVGKGTEEGETYYVIEEDQRISLEFYKNMVVHFFATASFVCAELAVEAPLAREKLWEAYRRLRERLRLEFPDVDDVEQEVEFEVALTALARAGVIQRGDSVGVLPAGRRRLRLLASLAHSFFESYYAASRAVAGAAPASEKELFRLVDSVAMKLYRNGVLERRESTAKPLLANSLKQLISGGVLSRNATGPDSSRLKVDETRRRSEERFWARFLRL